MASTRALANETFRDFVMDGVPSSGAHKPQKAEIIALFERIGGYASKDEAAGAAIPADQPQIILKGFYAEGDCPPAIWERVNSGPAIHGRFQSADGAWWQIKGPELWLDQVGGKPLPTFDNAPYLRDLLTLTDVVRLGPSPLGRGFNSTVLITGKTVTGDGQNMSILRAMASGFNGFQAGSNVVLARFAYIGLRFDAENDASAGIIGAYGIGIHIENVTCNDWDGQGIALRWCAKSRIVNPTTLNNGHRGINISPLCDDITISNPTAYDNNKAGILIGQGCTDVQVTGGFYGAAKEPICWVHQDCNRIRFMNMEISAPNPDGGSTKYAVVIWASRNVTFDTVNVKGWKKAFLLRATPTQLTGDPDIDPFLTNNDVFGCSFVNVDGVGDGTAGSAFITLDTGEPATVGHVVRDIRFIGVRARDYEFGAVDASGTAQSIDFGTAPVWENVTTPYAGFAPGAMTGLARANGLIGIDTAEPQAALHRRFSASGLAAMLMENGSIANVATKAAGFVTAFRNTLGQWRDGGGLRMSALDADAINVRAVIQTRQNDVVRDGLIVHPDGPIEIPYVTSATSPEDIPFAGSPGRLWTHFSSTTGIVSFWGFSFSVWERFVTEQALATFRAGLAVERTTAEAGVAIRRYQVPVASMVIGSVAFNGYNVALAPTLYAQVKAHILTPADTGVGASRLEFITMSGGSAAARLVLEGGMRFPGLTDPGAGKINATGYRVNNGGTLSLLKTMTVAHTFGSIPANSEATQAVTITGVASTGFVAMVNASTSTAGIIYAAQITAADTVTIVARNITSGAITPAAATMTIITMGTT
jgi:hypothetical protein